MKKIQILLAAAFVLILPAVILAQNAALRPHLPRGYLIVQDLSVCERSE